MVTPISSARLWGCAIRLKKSLHDQQRTLQECYEGVTKVLQGSYKGVTKELKECYKGVTRVSQGYYKGVARMVVPGHPYSIGGAEVQGFRSLGSVTRVKRVLQGCYKGATRVLHVCCKSNLVVEFCLHGCHSDGT
jgi:hypothetical protein